MPSCFATVFAVVRLSPVSMTMRSPARLSAVIASGAVSRTGSATAMTSDALPSTARNTAVAPSCRSRSAIGSSSGAATPSSARNFALPSATRWRSIMPTTPFPVGESKPRTSGSSMPRSAAAATMALRDRVLAAALDGGGETQDVLLVEAMGRRHCDDPGPALGERARLVDHQRVDLFQLFSAAASFIEHALLRAAADADHDRHRRGEAERAGAGDDQHRPPHTRTRTPAAAPPGPRCSRR